MMKELFERFEKEENENVRLIAKMPLEEPYDGEIAGTISCCLLDSDNKHLFLIDEGPALMEYLEIVNERFARFFRHMSNEVMTLILVGKTIPDPEDHLPDKAYIFQVTDIKVRIFEELISGSCFKFVVDRLKGGGACQRPAFRAKDDLRLAVETLPLPDGLRSWAQRELAALPYARHHEEAQIRKILGDALSISWDEPIKVNLDYVKTELDKRFWGLKKAKQAILRYAAAANAGVNQRGLLFVGPPGVGKTKMAEFAASLLEMPLLKLDVATLKEDGLLGSYRVYDNGKASAITDLMVRNATNRVCVLLNELGTNTGLEVVFHSLLDGTGYHDLFWQTEIPGGFVFATANRLEEISGPVRDRFFIVELDDYSYQDKLVILKDFILPRAQENWGMKISIEKPEFLLKYCRGSGVRDLERTVDALLAQATIEGNEVYKEERIVAVLGEPPQRESIRRIMPPGLGYVRGCYYSVQKRGWKVFLLSGNSRAGSGQITCLGPFSETQKSYAKVAMSLLQRVYPEVNEDFEILLHTPVDDGGIDVFSSLFYLLINSLIMGKPIDDETVIHAGCDMSGVLYNPMITNKNGRELLDTLSGHQVKRLLCSADCGLMLQLMESDIDIEPMVTIDALSFFAQKR